MKKLFFVTGITIISFSAAFAQEVKATNQQVPASRSVGYAGKVTPEKAAEIKTARMNSIVTLTEEQKKKVYELYLKEQISLRARAADHKDAKAEIEGMLNSDQKQKLAAFEAERKDKMLQQSATMRGTQQAAPAQIKR